MSLDCASELQNSPEERAAAEAGAKGGAAEADGEEREEEEEEEQEAEPASQPQGEQPEPDVAEPTAAAAEPAAEQEGQAMDVDATASAPAAGEKQAAAAAAADGGAEHEAAAADTPAEAVASQPGVGKGRKRGGKKQQGDKQPGKPAGVAKGPAGRSGGRGGGRGGLGRGRGGGRGGGRAGGRGHKQQHAGGFGALTMADISADKLTKLAEANWSARALEAGGGKPPAYDADLVARVYREELGGGADKPPTLRRVQLLEITQYLENYLWPHYAAGAAGAAAYEHLMSMVVMVNQKFREQVAGWTCFQQHNKVSGGAGGLVCLLQPAFEGHLGCLAGCVLAVPAPLPYKPCSCPSNFVVALSSLALQESFPAFFQSVLALKAEQGERMRMHERVAYLVFMINSFQV
jgi:hypothetical protein